MFGRTPAAARTSGRRGRTSRRARRRTRSPGPPRRDRLPPVVRDPSQHRLEAGDPVGLAEQVPRLRHPQRCESPEKAAADDPVVRRVRLEEERLALCHRAKTAPPPGRQKLTSPKSSGRSARNRYQFPSVTPTYPRMSKLCSSVTGCAWRSAGRRAMIHELTAIDQAARAAMLVACARSGVVSQRPRPGRRLRGRILPMPRCRYASTH